ncbi:hypothetical protein [uncultured Tateyamaria sp.]|nr:hypothetical protein [uncultured Tateyamaria sp.]
MYRRHVSATKHAFVLAGLCGAVFVVYIVSETFAQISPTAERPPLAPATRPLSVVTELTVPLLILLCLGAWHALTSRWLATPQRLLSYSIHWIIMLGWLAVSLLEPNNIFATTGSLEKLKPEDFSALLPQNSAAMHFYERAVLEYLGLTVALFVLPLLANLRRTS